MNPGKELQPLIKVLCNLRKEGRLPVAILYGSYARGTPHKRSDIDLAIFIKSKNDKEAIEILDKILMSTERDISILRLDDEDESPFVIQEALKGIHLIEPNNDIIYSIADRVLHETEEIRFRRTFRV